MSSPASPSWSSNWKRGCEVRLLNPHHAQAQPDRRRRRLHERVVRLLAELDDAETSLSSAALAPRGRLRIDVPSPLARPC
ncbi:hypothetical protein ACPA9J_24360 [Pseudomonas aeruginosa]